MSYIDYDEFSQEDIENLPVENRRSRLFCGILYNDCDEHKFAIDCLINSKFKSVAIIHDRDVREDGEIKKSHIHFVIKFENGKYLEKVAKDLHIKPNYLQTCSSFNSYCKYMIHIDEPFKVQYFPQEVFGSLFNDFLSAIATADSDVIKAIKIMNYIHDNNIVSFRCLLQWVCDNGLFDVYRKNYNIFKDLKFEKDGRL